MLNRVYIAIGVLLIAIMAAAFVVPRFYDWNVYRERVEAIAAEALGTEVAIRGDMSFTLLPQPQMVISDIVVGEQSAPLLEIARADAHLNLMEFMRDIYAVQRLDLNGLKLHLTIDEAGQWRMPIELPQNVSRDNVSIDDAVVTNSEILMADQRSGEVWRLEQIDGHLSAAGLRGPFAFEAQGLFQDKPYDIRLNSSDISASGDMRLSAYVSPKNKQFALSSDGVLSVGGDKASFAGAANLRVTPVKRDDGDVRGDLTVTSKVIMDAEKLAVSEFTLVPDENRAGTRLVGTGDLQFGAERHIDVTISGGVVPLIPADALTDRSNDPYSLVGLLIDLPAPPQIGVKTGNLQLDINELGLGDFALRDVVARLALRDEIWQVNQFSTRLAGDSSLNLTGKLIAAQERASFDGEFEFSSERLDALARGWRTFTDDNPLFGATAKGTGRLRVSSSGVNLAATDFTLDENSLDFIVDWREEKARRLVINAQLGDFDQQGTNRLLAFLPDAMGDEKFSQTFPLGRFSLKADQIVLRETPIKQAELNGKWSDAGIEVDLLSANDVAGVAMQSNGVLTGTVNAPKLWGTARFDLLPRADIEQLARLLPVAHPKLIEILQLNRPSRFDITLLEPVGEAQKLSAEAVNADLKLEAAFDFDEGVFNFAGAPSVGAVFVSARHGQVLFDRLGLVGDGFTPSTPAQLSFEYQGTLSNSIEAKVGYEAGSTRLNYDGSLIVSDLANVRGTGALDAELTDVEGFSGLFGFDGIMLPPFAGTAELKFTAADKFELGDIKIRAADEDVTGDLAMNRLGGQAVYSGNMRLSRLSVEALAQYLGGASAMLQSAETGWPDGPFSISTSPLDHRGRVSIETPILLADERVFLTDVGMDLSWTANENRIRNLAGARGEGEVGVDLTLCCHGGESLKQLNGRFRLDGVALGELFGGPVGETLRGFLTGAGRIATRGADFAQMAAALGGDGSFTVDDFAIDGINSEIFAHIGAMDNLTELEPAAFKEQIEGALDEGTLHVPKAEGLFSLASGKLLLRNFSIEDNLARLFGAMSLDVAQFALNGDWQLTPTQSFGDGEVLSESAAQITYRIGGTLFAPEVDVDVAPMADAIQMRAFELEVEELEELRAEQEARARAQAEEQQRRMAEQAARLAQEEAAKAQAEAERRAAEKAAAEAAQEQEAQQQEAPFDLAPDDPITFDPETGLPIFLDPDALYLPEQSAPLDLTEGLE